MQLVSLTEGGERVTMSKRAGDDRPRSTTCSTTSAWTRRAGSCPRSHDSTLEIDLELARSESQDNPVYYVQYAHARIASHPPQGGGGARAAGARGDIRASSEQLPPVGARRSSSG